jgi:hypothetical protein
MRIPLEKAYLCASCNSIDNRSNWCDGCASGAQLISVASLLNRTNSPAPSGSANERQGAREEAR